MNGYSEHLGPYELRGEIGRGAMARVWRAYDPNLDREVAIKEPLFDPRLGDDVLEEMGRRFVREGKVAARLNHPGIVTIYAADVYDGRPAIVMELVEGLTLAELLEAGSLAPDAVLDVLDQLLDAVGYAHAEGVIHRDIKPDNIFIDAQGRVKLADFGIARIDDACATTATVVGAVLGTPGYMSPEQATGAPVDARSDLFSVGVVAYEMFAGCNPFGAGSGADSTTIIYRIVHEPVPELPSDIDVRVSNNVRPAIMKALAKNPAERPQSAAEFKAMLFGNRPADGFVRAGGRSLGSAALREAPSTARKYIPFIALAAACIVVLLVVFVSAVSGTGGGGGGGAARGVVTIPASTSATAMASGASDNVEEMWFGSILNTENGAVLNDLSRIEGSFADPRNKANKQHGRYASLDLSNATVDSGGKSGTCTMKMRWEPETDRPVQGGVFEYEGTMTVTYDPSDPDVLFCKIGSKGDYFWGKAELSETEFLWVEGQMTPGFLDDPSHKIEMTKPLDRIS